MCYLCVFHDNSKSRSLLPFLLLLPHASHTRTHKFNVPAPISKNNNLSLINEFTYRKNSRMCVSKIFRKTFLFFFEKTHFLKNHRDILPRLLYPILFVCWLVCIIRALMLLCLSFVWHMFKAFALWLLDTFYSLNLWNSLPVIIMLKSKIAQ